MAPIRRLTSSKGCKARSNSGPTLATSIPMVSATTVHLISSRVTPISVIGPIPRSSSHSLSTATLFRRATRGDRRFSNTTRTQIFRRRLTIMTGSIAITSCWAMTASSVMAGFCRLKAGLPIRKSTIAAPPRSAQPARLPLRPRFNQRPTITAEQTSGFANAGAKALCCVSSALTFGTTIYHGSAPFEQFINPDLYADRDAGGTTRLNQDRTSNYQAFFAENLFRFGRFHIVPSFRLDHESVEVNEIVTPFNRPLADASAEHTVPLWGIGLGNDFLHGNETYFSASSGWRPTRYFDVVSPFSPTFTPGHPSDPFTSLDFELGVHGTPDAVPGLWYDVGLFWMDFTNRTETAFLNPGVNNDTILINSGATRHRGFEGQVSYDLLQLFDSPASTEITSSSREICNGSMPSSPRATSPVKSATRRPLPPNGLSKPLSVSAKITATTSA